LNGFAANLEGARKVVDLLRPLLTKSAAELLPRIDDAADELAMQLASLRSGDGYQSYETVSTEQREQIAAQAKALADALDGIDPALGLSTLR
jgi:iron uptake system component EfeO